jgi:hypothetical protein
MSIFPRRTPIASEVTLHIRVFLSPGIEPQLVDQTIRIRDPDGREVLTEAGRCLAVAPERSTADNAIRSAFLFGEPPLLSLSRPFEAPVVMNDALALWDLLHGPAAQAPSDTKLFSGLLMRSVSRTDLHKLAFVLATMNLSTHRYLVVPASVLQNPGRYTIEMEMHHVTVERVQGVSVDDSFYCDHLELIEPAAQGRGRCVIVNPGPEAVPVALIACGDGDTPRVVYREIPPGEHVIDCDPAAVLRYCEGAALLPVCPSLPRVRRLFPPAVGGPDGWTAHMSALRADEQEALRLANGLRAWDSFVEQVGGSVAERLIELGLIAASPMEQDV